MAQVAVEVRDEPDAEGGSRFSAYVDGQLAGVAVYRLDRDAMTFLHTETAPEHEHEGIASALARFALDQVRRDGSLDVVPQCPFIAGWIERHPEYHYLLA